MVSKLAYSLAAASLKRDIPPLIPFDFFPPQHVWTCPGRRRGKPPPPLQPVHDAEKVHILEVNTVLMWVSQKLQGDVRTCPYFPDQREGKGNAGGGVGGGGGVRGGSSGPNNGPIIERHR